MAQELPADDSISVPPFTAQPSVETTLVEIRFDGESLHIPRNYLETARLSKTHIDTRNYFNTAAIVIAAMFPKFAGAEPDTIHWFEMAGVQGNIIKIYPLGPKSQVGQIDLRNAPAVADAKKTQVSKVYGLTRVAEKTSLVPQDVYVGYGATSAKPIVISCAREKDRVPPLDCSVYFEMRGLPFLYRYNASLLRHWRTIDKNVVDLLKSFFGGEAQ